MSFRILGLSPSPFRHLYGLPDAELARHGAKRYVADECPGFPDRIELRDAEVGESLILVNFVHQPADTPYRSAHAIFVREGAEKTYDRVDEVPESIARRLISLRGFNQDGMMLQADVLKGVELAQAIPGFFQNPGIAYLHAHNAKQGCYAARIERA